ncbi:helix-turn-helix domain-containing protein, partial [Streptococcus pyogenes]
MSNINFTRKSFYSHLSATERGEIARLLGKAPQTIHNEIKRGLLRQ